MCGARQLGTVGRAGIAVFFLLWSAGILAWCSDTSPLYVFAPTHDPAIFFMCGQGILQGLLPYADMADTKGPLWMLIYALAAWVDDRSLTGVFVLQCVTFWVTLCVGYKTSRFYLSRSGAVLVMLLMSLIFFNRYAYMRGGGIEEICWPVPAMTVYAAVRFFHCRGAADLRLLAWVLGAGIGAMLMIKFSIALPLAGGCVFLYVWLRRHAGGEVARKAICMQAVACGVVVLPCMVWLWREGALHACVQEYILAGIRYGTVDANHDWLRWVRPLPFMSFADLMMWGAVIGAWRVYGWQRLRGNTALVFTVVLYAMFKVVMLVCYIRYYNVICAPLLVWVAIFWVGRFDKVLNVKKVAAVAMGVVCVMAVLMYTDQGECMRRGHFAMGAVQRAKPIWVQDGQGEDVDILAHFDGARCLYLGCLDNGFGIPYDWRPCGRYWFLQNSPTEQMRQEQYDYVARRLPDIVYNGAGEYGEILLREFGYEKMTVPSGRVFWRKGGE